MGVGELQITKDVLCVIVKLKNEGGEDAFLIIFAFYFST